MQECTKNSITLGLVIAFSFGFFLFANEFKANVNNLDAGEKDGIESHSWFYQSGVPLDQMESHKETMDVIELPKAELFQYNRTVYAKVTAYTPGEESCGKFADGITSTGSNAWIENGAATDPGIVAYGSWLYIPGVGYREVDDTGSAMKKSWKKNKVVHIDLRFQDVNEARRWGVKWMPVHVYHKE